MRGRNRERIARTAIGTTIALVALLYLGDYLALRFRIPGGREPFGTVHIRPYLAVPQKNGKTEFIADDPRDQACVHSLFPHMGDLPCWYVERQKNQRIDM